MNGNSNNKEIQIDLPDTVSDGQYSNLAIITHSPTEFIIDFVNIMPGVPKGKVKSRIILAPVHAKRLLGALNDNIKKYENNFGIIDEDPHGFEFNVKDMNPTGNA